MKSENTLSLSERLRGGCFAYLDGFRQHPLADEVALLEDYFRDPEGHEAARRGRLEDLLRYVRVNVPHYRGLDLGDDLDRWPVVNKDTIRTNPESFRQDGADSKDLTRVTTSGSSGQPFECFHEPAKVRRKLADLLYFNGLASYEVGMRHMLIRATAKPKWKLWLQNEIWVDPTHWDDGLRASMREQLRQGGVRVAIGYPSIMADLAAYCREKGDSPQDFPLHSYIVTSEVVSPVQRDLIREVFGCLVVSRYASEEFGVIGQSGDDCERFQINAAGLVVEILDENDQPVETGACGRVVVTDLTMRAMPLIRYDLGDLAVTGPTPKGMLGVAAITSLEGKLTDAITDARGSPVAPLAVLVAFKKVRGVRQFQFAQTGPTAYELRLSPESSEADAGMQAILAGILGKEATVTVRKMAEIPTLPSGKRPVVVNEWKGARPKAGCGCI